MWRFTHVPESTRADAERFLSNLNKQADFFSPQQSVVVARAPGRLDLMGGIADYSGALVLELPLAAATWAAVQFSDEPAITLRSTGVEDTPQVTIELAELARLDYTAAHTLLTRDPERSWAAYVAGCLIVLQRECGLLVERGLRLFLHSNVPAGKGVSSSAALEVATMQALSTLYDMHIAGRELALLCQKVENLVVGAPCGIMDQMTSACGEQDSLLALLCQPAELQESITLPNELEVWGIDSGIRHAVTGADYGSVRIGAFMGYRIIADLAGLPVQTQGEQSVSIEDSRWQGYLANISPSLWERAYRERLPHQIHGAAFLRQYQGSTDSVTHIDPTCTYAVRQPTAHPIYEHHRVRLFRALLARPVLTDEDCCLLGELMYQSHASYSACGLGSNGTDRLVELVRQAGPRANLYGAKITGGGSGGTVAVLARRGSQAQIEHIAALYAQETGYAVEILGGSSPGAVAWGSQQLVVA
ncbi:galactokinase [Ktedonobacter sp. SOSP1-85]|uniref:galactokinase n=1 Tax=Ktedonobacter sp. SOSP1-85 TaxID=2778367 RepID=UPI0019153180|nr:galactokinase family protein [Ktedonobacter sp. SOSP1-85]GHO78352.1 galactokinase [Ktedonobacter sp. SOSP1-85]